MSILLTLVLLTPGMVLLSEKPKDAAPVRPKTLDFQARRRKEEEKELQKAAQFARLSVSHQSLILTFIEFCGTELTWRIVASNHCRLLPRSRRSIPLTILESIHLCLKL